MKMTDSYLHIDPNDVPESSVSLLLRGLDGIVREKDEEVYRARLERDYYKEQQTQLPQASVVADGMQKKLIAILNAIYESGYIVNCSKKEFMQRMATILGCPGLADYSKGLYNVKNTYQYEEIFTDLAKVAHNEILKNG